MSEVVSRVNHLINEFDKRVQAAPSGSWTNQSPCEEWNARNVVEHVANNLFRIASGGAENPRTVAVTDNIATAWTDARVAFQRAIPHADLAATVAGPMGPMPLGDILGRLVANDVLVHTWDLARTVGGDERLDQDAVAGAYSGLKPLDAMIRRPGIFGDKADAPAGADLQTEFLSFLGRKV